jgi:hypothetical protein
MPGIAVHTSGRYLLDRQIIPRRYIFLDYIDPEGPGGWSSAENFVGVRFASAPPEFPEEDWIPIDES